MCAECIEMFDTEERKSRLLALATGFRRSIAQVNLGYVLIRDDAPFGWLPSLNGLSAGALSVGVYAVPCAGKIMVRAGEHDPFWVKTGMEVFSHETQK